MSSKDHITPEGSITRDYILEKAQELVGGDRKEAYGSAQDGFGRVAAMWSSYLGLPVDAGQVAMMMVLLKVCRTTSSPRKGDSYVDIAGYAALCGEIEHATEEL